MEHSHFFLFNQLPIANVWKNVCNSFSFESLDRKLQPKGGHCWRTSLESRLSYRVDRRKSTLSVTCAHQYRVGCRAGQCCPPPCPLPTLYSGMCTGWTTMLLPNIRHSQLHQPTLFVRKKVSAYARTRARWRQLLRNLSRSLCPQGEQPANRCRRCRPRGRNPRYPESCFHADHPSCSQDVPKAVDHALVVVMHPCTSCSI